MMDKDAFAAFLTERSIDPATFARDAALYELISKHGFRPVVWKITPEEEPALAAYFDQLLRLPVTDTDDQAEQRKREAARHAPLFRAIKQSTR